MLMILQMVLVRNLDIDTITEDLRQPLAASCYNIALALMRTLEGDPIVPLECTLERNRLELLLGVSIKS